MGIAEREQTEKVLVLLSAYNGEKYLPELLASVLNQKDADLHILIRDDGSKDSTAAYLKTVKDARVECYFGENKGTADSFLTLIQKAPADYDYYAFCDQDDIWLEDKVSTAVRKLKTVEEQKPSLYYSGQIITDGDLQVLFSHDLDTQRSIKANCIFNQMAGCTAVFNKALLQEMKKHTPQDIYMHDAWCYQVCAALGGNIFVESAGKILYRQHGDNAVGLRGGLRGKLANARAYIFKYRASGYAREILKGYSDQLDENWRTFLLGVTASNTSFAARMRMLTDPEIVFHSFVLRVIFGIKVLLRKL